MKILKFGGSSVGNAERIKSVVDIVIKSLQVNKKVAVVFSAFQGITDLLIEAGTQAATGGNLYLTSLEKIVNKHKQVLKELVKHENYNEYEIVIERRLNELTELLQGVFLIKELTPKTLDYLMSFGERLSCQIITFCFNDKDIKADFCDARKFIKTDDNYNNAKVDLVKTYANIDKYFEKKTNLQVITGFISSTVNEETTTLGRGGSDYTASIIGAALNVEEIEIWTDVDGVLTADPRKVHNSFPVLNLSYEEAMELSHFGAKVIHPPTMYPAMIKQIPIRIKNTFNPNFVGTIIGAQNTDFRFRIKGISSIDEVSILRIQGPGMVGVAGIAKRLFGTLATAGINIILISQASSEHSICLAILPRHTSKAKKIIEDEFVYEIKDGLVNEVVVENQLSIIAVVGENMRMTAGNAGKVFQALGKNSINIIAIAQGSSELNISMVIAKERLVEALNVIHNEFFNKIHKVNLFIAGVGNVGSELLNIFSKKQKQLLESKNVELNLVGIANSKKMIFDKKGIDFSNYISILGDSHFVMNSKDYVKNVFSNKAENNIFVDCTTSQEIADCYLELLENGINVVAANKKASSGNYDYYKKLKSISNGKVKYLYETNVGAGLPILETIKGLIESGDEIISIEAVLSGTLSYIFNNFYGNKKFSDIIAEAKENGYTEPDPRDDLNGMDVLRKLVILIRECGIKIEAQEVEKVNILPEDIFDKSTVEAFLEKIKLFDDDFENVRKDAEKEGKKLRYIAEFSNHKAQIALKTVAVNSPFYHLTNTDNLIVIKTSNYYNAPLVIQGPGAGIKVTAAGVMTDIMKIINNVG